MNYLVKTLTVTVFLIISGCASGPDFVMQDPSTEMATIYAFRTSSMVGAANSDIVAVNDKFIGRLNSGTYVMYEVSPGPVVISRKAGSVLGKGNKAGWGLGGLVGAVDGFIVVEEFTAAAGEVYFVRFSHGKLVERTKALEKMNGLKNVTPPVE